MLPHPWASNRVWNTCVGVCAGNSRCSTCCTINIRGVSFKLIARLDRVDRVSPGRRCRRALRWSWTPGGRAGHQLMSCLNCQHIRCAHWDNGQSVKAKSTGVLGLKVREDLFFDWLKHEADFSVLEGRLSQCYFTWV